MWNCLPLCKNPVRAAVDLKEIESTGMTYYLRWAGFAAFFPVARRSGKSLYFFFHS